MRQKRIVKQPQLTNYCLTGFPQDQQKMKRYQQGLKKLGACYIQKLAQKTNILVAYETFTQKYKIAKLNKIPIICVTQKWIQQSISKKRLQPVNTYQITQKQMFINGTIAVCGFSPQHTKKIQQIITQRNGRILSKYKASDIIKRFQEIVQKQQEYIDVILASKDQIERAKLVKLPKENDHMPPLVGIEWLEDSLKKKRCKYPPDYAVNLLITKPLGKYYNKLNTILDNYIQVNDIMDKSTDFLANVVIFMDIDTTIDMIKTFKNLIAVCGGYWVEKFNSSVTHVIVSQIQYIKYQSYKKYGNRIHILRAEWLVDSICLYKHLQEEDYFIRNFRINDKQMQVIYKQQAMRSQNSINFNNNSVSVLFNPVPVEPLKKSKSTTEHKSQIFKNRNFYIQKSLLKEPFYNQLNRLICQNGGNTYYVINRRMKVYVPLKDSPNNQSIAASLEEKKYNIMVVSDRWIKYCIKKNQFIQPKINEYFQFKAFNFNVPLPDFHKLIFDLAGFDKITALRIKEILPILGSTKTNPNRSQISHVLCGPEYREIQAKRKIQSIYVINNKIKLVRESWLISCLNQGKIVDMTQFLISKSQSIDLFMPNSTPNKAIDQQKQVKLQDSQIIQKNNDSGKTKIQQTP